MITESIILSGGFGTRLRSVVSDLPKPMAPVAGKPFLEYLLNFLLKYNIQHVVLSVGFKHEKISDYFGNKYKGIDISYAIEDTPLGTGGGIQNALKYIHGKSCYLLNGDSFINVDLYDFYKFHQETNSTMSLSLKKLQNFDRYGAVQIRENRVVGFESKKFRKEGFMNSGVYIIPENLFKNKEFNSTFSFEDDFLSKYSHLIKMGAYLTNAYFVDIGIPEDYEKACEELPAINIISSSTAETLLLSYEIFSIYSPGSSEVK